MLKSPIKSPLFAATLCLLAASAAHADLKVVQTTQISSPQLQAYLETMTPQQRAQMAKSGNPLLSGAPTRTVVYIQGDKTRAEIGPMIYILVPSTHNTAVLNPKAHTYTLQPYKAPALTGTGKPQVTVKDTGQSKVILGHPAKHYLMKATLPSQPGTVIQGDVWAATDIPKPTMLATGGPLASLQEQFSKIKGYPLRTTLVITGSPMGNTTVKSNVVSVSKAALPGSLFKVPAGYKKTTAGG